MSRNEALAAIAAIARSLQLHRARKRIEDLFFTMENVRIMSRQNEACRRPESEEYFEFYSNYVSQVPPGDFFQLLNGQVAELRGLFENVNEEQALTLHAPYTWTCKQVVGHLIDAERIFANRLHRFSAGDLQPLPGMDQGPYITNNDYVAPSLRSLVDELVHCRQANALLLRRIKPESWDNCGIASGHPITVRALAYILIGHINHHLKILRQRLGK